MITSQMETGIQPAPETSYLSSIIQTMRSVQDDIGIKSGLSSQFHLGRTSMFPCRYVRNNFLSVGLCLIVTNARILPSSGFLLNCSISVRSYTAP
jgi:hypothetical protein